MSCPFPTCYRGRNKLGPYRCGRYISLFICIAHLSTPEGDDEEIEGHFWLKAATLEGGIG